MLGRCREKCYVFNQRGCYGMFSVYGRGGGNAIGLINGVLLGSVGVYMEGKYTIQPALAHGPAVGGGGGPIEWGGRQA